LYDEKCETPPVTRRRVSIVNARASLDSASAASIPSRWILASHSRAFQSLYWKRPMIRTSRSIPLDRIRLVIFDLDGTLIDSERDLAAAVNAMLRKYGRKELPLEVIGTYIGDGAPMLIRRALGDPADREFLQEALNYFLLYYREHKLNTTYP